MRLVIPAKAGISLLLRKGDPSFRWDDDMAQNDNPLESFRQVLTGASRAIAREAELELGFTADAPAVSGKSVKVPMPPAHRR